MEEGQKVNIDLESPIDVKSSDMLVPINQPQFAHNRQKYQGHCLPNSLRFELDGWAAGSTVYNFDSDENEYYEGNWKIIRSKLNNNPAYLFQYYYKQPNGTYKYVGNICYNVLTAIAGQYGIDRKDLNVSGDILTGDYNGKHFIIAIRPDTYVDSNKNTYQYFDVTVDNNSATLIAGSSLTLNGLAFESVAQNNGIVVLKIKDATTSTGDISIMFKRPSSIITDEGYTLADYNNTVGTLHTFKKYNTMVQFDTNGNNLTVTSDLYPISNVTKTFINNTLTFSFIMNYSDRTRAILSFEKLYYAIDDITVNTASSGIKYTKLLNDQGTSINLQYSKTFSFTPSYNTFVIKTRDQWAQDDYNDAK